MPALWYRGLAPAAWEYLPAPPEIQGTRAWGEFKQLDENVALDLDDPRYRE